MKNYEDKLREEISKAEIPSELEPENIKTMLEEKAPKKKRSGIKVAGRIVAGAAACAMIGGSAIYYAGRAGELSRNNSSGSSGASETSDGSSSGTDTAKPGTGTADNTSEVSAPYMNGANSYATVYKLFSRAARGYGSYSGYNGYTTGAKAESEADYATADEESYDSESSANGTGGKGGEAEYSDTYNQEEGVLEADKFKTDGRYIYYLPQTYGTDVINIAEADNGHFVSSASFDISDAISLGNDDNYYCSINDMYLYNDMLTVIGSYNTYIANDSEDDVDYWGYSKQQTFVAFFTPGTEPELINVYYQDGWYDDSRISPDGYLYLTTNYRSCSFSQIKDSDETDKYIPSAGMNGSVECIPAENVLLPERDFDPCGSLAYTVIGSIDLNESGAPASTDSKALAGYSGTIYCSAENLYVTLGWDDTAITRIAISGGSISPQASGTVTGYIKDQFSMSEYNGYFRVATTSDEYDEVFHRYGDDEWFEYEEYDIDPDDGYYSYELVKRDNRVYVLDMDLNEVGSISDFGLDETIRSVNFSGDLAYVVTFEKTDPLFAIDLSEPTEPTILSELHMNGYSTYMQKWDDGLLLGFGVDADSDGTQTGIKLAMYDNSDPNDLREAGVYTRNYYDYGGSWETWISSPAVWDRKALLIAPEKNLIGVPVYGWYWNGEKDEYRSSVMFFSYEDGDFSLLGEVALTEAADGVYYYYDEFDRVMYIDGYVYALSGQEFVSADMENFEITDSVKFEYDNDYNYWMYDYAE